MSEPALPPYFTWQGFLDWVEAHAPATKLWEAQRLFDLLATKGYVSPVELDESNRFVYTLTPRGREVTTLSVDIKRIMS
jgi:hypothetical protein